VGRWHPAADRAPTGPGLRRQLDPLTSVAEAITAATARAIVISRRRRGVSQLNARLARKARVPDAAPTAVIALAMHCMHMPP
jgi:hypothetical protein